MPRQPMKYSCTSCGRFVPRADVVIKRVVFTTPGQGQRTIKSRVIQHLCPACKERDPEWAIPPHRDTQDYGSNDDGREVEESDWLTAPQAW